MVGAFFLLFLNFNVNLSSYSQSDIIITVAFLASSSLKREEVGGVSKTKSDKKGSVTFSQYFTDKKGVKHYAKDYGKKAFPFFGTKKKKA